MRCFITPDSIIPYPNDPLSLNRYSYVRNNPLNLTDPSGQFFGFILLGAAIGYMVGGYTAAVTGGDPFIGAAWGALGGAVGAAVGGLAGASAIYLGGDIGTITVFSAKAATAGAFLAGAAGGDLGTISPTDPTRAGPLASMQFAMSGASGDWQGPPGPDSAVDFLYSSQTVYAGSSSDYFSKDNARQIRAMRSSLQVNQISDAHGRWVSDVGGNCCGPYAGAIAGRMYGPSGDWSYAGVSWGSPGTWIMFGLNEPYEGWNNEITISGIIAIQIGWTDNKEFWFQFGFAFPGVSAARYNVWRNPTIMRKLDPLTP